MYNIPARLNGYTIIAAVTRVEPNGRQVSNQEVVILGHDPGRRSGKYVTAMVSALDPSPTEWYWGYYTEDLGLAIRSLAKRSNMDSMLETVSN